jgi:hypothetical protein
MEWRRTGPLVVEIAPCPPAWDPGPQSPAQVRGQGHTDKWDIRLPTDSIAARSKLLRSGTPPPT